MRKSTNKELVTELEAINKNGRLDAIIEKAKNNHYHDYKAPKSSICGKMDFVNDASSFPELKPLRAAVMNGEYDEVADEEDKADMRKDVPANMWDMLGLNPSN